MRFVDTNVLLYAVSRLPEDAGKRRRARELLREKDLTASVQVFQEFYHQATRPTRPGRLSDEDAIAFLGTLLGFPVQDVTLDLFRDAVALSRRFKLSYWDGAILASARAAGCDVNAASAAFGSSGRSSRPRGRPAAMRSTPRT